MISVNIYENIFQVNKTFCLVRMLLDFFSEHDVFSLSPTDRPISN